MTPRRSADDAGFTLIEAVIAVAILGTTVVVLVTALAGLISAGQYHRGNAVAETGTRNFTQALQARVAARTTLTAAVTPTETALSVADTTHFSTSGFVTVDREIMRITGRTPTQLTVERGAARDYDAWPEGDLTSVVAHAANAPVAPAYMCPSSTELTPETSQYQVPTGVTVTISTVEYWDPATSTFLSGRGACIDAYKTRCVFDDGGTQDLRTDCDIGLQRVTINTSTAGDARFKDVPATTQLLVRKGSA